ncbi:class I SAM-dependent methyltransferase [Pseudonocardia hispaniensis]|uniref:Class I SAM-dependent methyltransferase n=1 Tax=Pseudonocardia hispaniensis TaxID=904933 RepID=A0ABW1IXP5_9PSEU
MSTSDWKRAGRSWARRADWHDIAFAPFDQPLLDAAGCRPGERALDVGCGAATITLALADQVGPTGTAIGVDVSESLCTTARTRIAAAGITNAEIALGDAATTDLGPAPFDVVVSRFGVMFFADPVAAFTHLTRVLRPGGRVAFAVFRERDRNPWVDLAVQALQPFLPPSEELGAEPAGFSMADPERVGAILGDAGLVSVGFTPVDVLMTIGGGEGVDGAFRAVAGQLLAAGILRRLDPPTKAAAHEALRTALAEHLDGPAVRLGGSAWIVTAHRPRPGPT